MERWQGYGWDFTVVRWLQKSDVKWQVYGGKFTMGSATLDNKKGDFLILYFDNSKYSSWSQYQGLYKVSSW